MSNDLQQGIVPPLWDDKRIDAEVHEGNLRIAGKYALRAMRDEYEAYISMITQQPPSHDDLRARIAELEAQLDNAQKEYNQSLADSNEILKAQNELIKTERELRVLHEKEAARLQRRLDEATNATE